MISHSEPGGERDRDDELMAIPRLAERIGVTPRVLRYWEEQQLISPTREHGKLRYSPRDLAIAGLIRALLDAGAGVEGIRMLTRLAERDVRRAAATAPAARPATRPAGPRRAPAPGRTSPLGSGGSAPAGGTGAGDCARPGPRGSCPGSPWPGWASRAGGRSAPRWRPDRLPLLGFGPDSGIGRRRRVQPGMAGIGRQGGRAGPA